MKSPDEEKLILFLKNATAEELAEFVEKMCSERPKIREPLVKALKELQESKQ